MGRLLGNLSLVVMFWAMFSLTASYIRVVEGCHHPMVYSDYIFSSYLFCPIQDKESVE